MKKLFILTLLMLLFAVGAQAQYVKILSIAEQSGKIVTSGITSTTSAAKTFPGATVTVYSPSGSGTIASIFSNSTGTVKANPFTASLTDATVDFFIAPGASFDIRISGVSGGVTITAFTRSGYTAPGTTGVSLALCGGTADTSLLAALSTLGGTIEIPKSITCASNSQTLSAAMQIDNGGLLKPLNSQTLILTGPQIGGTWQRYTNITLGTISFAGNKSVAQVIPEWWGAVADGSTNNTTAIQSAINAVVTVGAGTVVFGIGVYDHTALTLYNGVNLLGASKARSYVDVIPGIGSTLHNTSTTSGNGITIDYHNPVHGTNIEGLVIEGNSSSGYGLYINGRSAAEGGEIDAASEIRITNCQFSENGMGGVYIHFSFPVWISNCLFLQNHGYGIRLNSDVNAISITGSHLQGNYYEGLYGANTSADLSLTGTAIEGNNTSLDPTHYEVHLDNLRGGLIAGCYFETTTASRTLDIGAAATGLVIMGNAFHVDYQTTLASEITAIYAHGQSGFPADLEVHGNRFVSTNAVSGGVGIVFETYVTASSYQYLPSNRFPIPTDPLLTTKVNAAAPSGSFPTVASSFATLGAPATTSTQGTDTTPVNTETYMAQLNVPSVTTAAGLQILNGSAVAGHVKMSMASVNTTSLFAVGAPITAYTTASTSQTGTAVYQQIGFAAGEQVIWPGTYVVLVQFDTNTTPRFRTHTFGAGGAGKKTGETYGTFTTVTPPSSFTTALGPIVSLY